ncbi:metabolite traffic protein EboE [Streptomyces sp. TRM 70351]|uniref:metabolite traffic protein EboE n=1 Tax=Streptomyces sp. TRM 70351 TaxID=3116552 RepID=UPI002E7BFBF2|nr:metabolite traffic protein EboE [Streptomyces sp. TRM 70351]MEE1926961.1 metabolite traffic protein EboE [Streptomyces sp. TRM 70351]
MRFQHPDGSTVHLAYCTNVHPAETLDGVLAQLRAYAEPVRRRLSRDRLGIGLWLARDAVRALTADPAAPGRLRAALDACGLETVTLNGFPYQGFGADRVKYRVYRPDWTERARLDHTAELAGLLAALLPGDVTEGTVSTLPLAWRTGFDDAARARALTHLTELAGTLDALQDRTGRSVRVALEPEPGCTVETTGQAAAALTAPGAPPAHRVGVCLDTCHLATAFEDPDTALDGLVRARVPVVKAQLSAALHAHDPADPAVREALGAFAEPRFLHQTRARTPGGVTGTDDLDEALAGPGLPTGGPWRVHLHVPLHAALQPPLTSTAEVLRAALARLVGGPAPLTRHLEVETYTWQALPPALRPTTAGELADGIAAELALARDLLLDLGLKELP